MTKNSKGQESRRRFRVRLPSRTGNNSTVSESKGLGSVAVLTKAAIASSVSASLILGLGYLAVATNYSGSIDIQIPNALNLKIQNQGQQK